MTQNLPENLKISSDQPLDTSKPTTGEKWYHWTTLLTNFVGTFISSGLIAFGVLKNSWYNENVTKKMEKWKLFGSKELGEEGAKNLNSTIWLMQGGNLMLIPMHYMEKSKKSIVQYFNKKYGKEGEQEIYEQRHAEVPQKSWGDFILGRIVAFLTVWGGFTAASKFIGKQMGAFEHGTGERFAKLLNKDPFKKDAAGNDLTDINSKGEEYKVPSTTNEIGRMFALDAFATATAVLILDVAASAFSKNKKSEKIEDKLKAAEKTFGIPAKEERNLGNRAPAEIKEEAPGSSKTYSSGTNAKSPKDQVTEREESYAAEREKQKSMPSEAAFAAV